MTSCALNPMPPLQDSMEYIHFVVNLERGFALIESNFSVFILCH